MTADLRLRFGALRVRSTVQWPLAGAAWLALVLRDELSPSDRWVQGSVVIALDGGHPERIELAILGWAAEHAAELGADGAHLLVAGGARAARLALAARENGWPELERQLLVHPVFSARQPMPHHVGGAPTATVVCGARRDHGRRYAERLRAAGVEVCEVRDADRR
jgi:acetyl esterase/lipase